MPEIKSVCDTFQNQIGGLERKCSVCNKKIANKSIILDFNPLKHESENLGIICQQCFNIECDMVREIMPEEMKAMSMGELWRNGFCMQIQVNKKMEELRREIRPKLLKLRG